MKKLIIAITLLGFSSCVRKESFSDYKCSSTIINYGSINDEPLFDNPKDTIYSEVIYNISDEDLYLMSELMLECVEAQDTFIFTTPNSSTTSTTVTNVIITDWNKL